MTRVWNTLLLLAMSTTLLFAQEEIGSKQPKTEQSGKTQHTVAGGKVDVNRASSEELTALNGIGEIYAALIIRDRPYRSTKDLIKRKVIPTAVYEGIKDKILVKPNSETPAQ